MRKRRALCGLRSTKNYRIKMDGTNEDSAEMLTVEPSEACVLQSSLDVDSYEGNDPKEQTIDEAEKDPEEESTEESEKDPEEETNEEEEEDTEEEPTDEEEKDPEEESKKDPGEEAGEEEEEDTEEEPTDEEEKDPEEESTEESKKDPEEEADEEEEEDTEEEPTDEEEMVEDSEEAPEEEMTEEAEEDTEEEPLTEEAEVEPDEEIIENVEEDPSEETTEELEEELTEESSECETPSNCCDDDPEQFVEDHMSDVVSKLSSEIDADEEGHRSKYVLYNANEKKRSVDATIGESTRLQTSARKKSRQESSKSTSESGFGNTDLGTNFGVSKAVIGEGTSAQKEGTGSSGKRRRSRWDAHPEGDSETGEGDRISKRRKTRWDVDDSQLKLLGPIQLPSFMKKFLDDSNLDSDIQQLKERLIELNSILKWSDLHDKKSEEISVKLRKKLIRERQDVISRLIQKNPTFQTPTDYKPQKHTKKLYIPVKEYPEYNFIGLILGPRGNTQKRMEKETGARIFLRGKGSSKMRLKKTDNEDLHVLIEADNQKSVDAAVDVVEKLLNPFNEGWSEHKVAQLKELSKLKATYVDDNKCGVCREKGHLHYACPSLQSNFNSYPTTTCTLTALSPAGNYVGISPGIGLGSTPNSKKEINEANLFVGYLPPTVDDNRLSELFSPFGKLTEVKIIKDRTTGSSKGYGFVKFENPIDAGAAIVHMNGLKMDGKMLAVRVAGPQSVSGSSAQSHLPLYPGPTVVSPVVPGQTTWPSSFMGPAVVSSVVPGQMSLLPSFIGPAVVSPVIPGQTSLPTSFMYMEQNFLVPQCESFGFSTPSNVSCLPGSLSATSLNSSYKRSDKQQFLSPVPLPQFQVNQDYPGYRFQSYLATPATSASPSSLAQFPGDPDYPGSRFL